MLTCNGPRCSGESCREADSIPWWAIQVILVPSSSVQALVPTCEASDRLEESATPCCDPACGVVGRWVAAASAAAAAPAVAVGAAGVPEPPAGAGLEAVAPVPEPEVRLWV